MKKVLVLAIIALAAVTVAGSVFAESRIVAMSGIVRVSPPAQPGSETWSQAAVGQPLVAGSLVMTGENSRVSIEVSPGNTVRLRGNAKIVIGGPQGRTTRFKLLSGVLRGAFNRLTGGERFEVEFSSMSAVASVKGTTFEAEEGSNGASIRTLFGAIEMALSGGSQSIPQGCGLFVTPGGVIQIRPLTEGEIQDGLGKGQGNRLDLHDFVQNSRDAAAADQDIIVQIREDDFAVGRSLRDVHGNLARVDQRLVRPTPYSIEFVNIVKRDSYRYNGKFSYAGSPGPRFDYLMGRIDFNMGLPDKVVAWPGFFMDNKDTLKATHAFVELANGRLGHATLVVRRDTNFGDNEGDAFKLNGLPLIVDGDAPTTDADGHEAGDLWATTVMTAYGDTNANGILDLGEKTLANRVDLRMEAYVLNATGKVLNVGDFTGNALNDPFGFAKTVAMESILSFADYRPAGTAVAAGNNIDLIVIPDLVIAIAERFGPSLATVDTGN
ncbi:MAG: FecR domain-containing protein [Candidatus Coatesbacteria bacterium]